MKRKGFTLVELLVVIGIIILLLGILMPALSKVKSYANRMFEGTSMAALGKSMQLYATDNDELFPVATHTSLDKTFWATQGRLSGSGAALAGATMREAIGGAPVQTTIGACWYLLIKYADATPKQFVSNNDAGTTAFDIQEYIDKDSKQVPIDPPSPLTEEDLREEDFWDFGDEPGIHYSYAYLIPFHAGAYQDYGISNLMEPAMPVAATRSPWFDQNAKSYINEPDPQDKIPQWRQGTGYYDPDGVWNSAVHKREGQNVMYADAHVDFEQSTNVGIQQDCIYREWGQPEPQQGDPVNPTKEERQLGVNPQESSTQNVGRYGRSGREDCMLVQEYNQY